MSRTDRIGVSCRCGQINCRGQRCNPTEYSLKETQTARETAIEEIKLLRYKLSAHEQPDTDSIYGTWTRNEMIGWLRCLFERQWLPK